MQPAPASLLLPVRSPVWAAAGYGNTGPQRCWVAAWLICIQSISNLLLNAIVLGIIFAKVRQAAPPATWQHPAALLPCCPAASTQLLLLPLLLINWQGCCPVRRWRILSTDSATAALHDPCPPACLLAPA
jgi:hypothetical protein